MDLIGKVPSLAPARGTSWHIGSLCFPRLAESKRIFLDKQILIGKSHNKTHPSSTAKLEYLPANCFAVERWSANHDGEPTIPRNAGRT